MDRQDELGPLSAKSMSTQMQHGSTEPGVGPDVGWQGRLDEASSAEEIVAVARDFIARISPEEFAALPAECRPHKIVDADDVVDFAVTLVRGACAGESASDLLLQQMAAFFTDACGRLSCLGARPSLTGQ